MSVEQTLGWERLLKDEPVTFATIDNRPVVIRRLQESDTPLLVEMFHHLSERTRRLRFHAYLGNVPEERIWQEAMALARLDPARQAALVAVIEEEGEERAVGVARFSRETPAAEEAEAALVVRDDFQNVGLGTHLTFELIHIARAMGIRRFLAWVLIENYHVLQMIKKIGLPLEQKTEMGETRIVVHIDEIDRLQALLD